MGGLRGRLGAVLATVLLALAGAAPAAAEGRCGTHPWCNTSLSATGRAKLLLAAMSQSDKVGILTGQAANDVGLPAISFTDGAVGAGGAGSGTSDATAMPAGIALAANFNRAMAHRYGAVVGLEVKHRGFDGDYGPTVNIMRTPLGGRTFEGYGEDPFLAAQTAVQWIDGLQAQGVMANVKHFAANNQEGQAGASPVTGAVGGRTFVNAIVSQRELHEIELPAFEAAVRQAHTATVMCSYNLLNGVYACANPGLLTSTLRDQWGFQGFVMSDAAACHEPDADLKAGLNFDIVGTCYEPPLVDAELLDGAVSQATLNQRVFEILRTLFAYGFFDHPTWKKDIGQDNVKGDEAVADAAEEGGAVLLKNGHGVLPLSRAKVRSIAVIGPAADQYIHGNGSSEVTPYLKTTALQGIETRAAQAGIKVTFLDGTDPQAAEAAAKSASVAIVVAADTESEGVDKVCMSLTVQCSGGGQATPPDPTSTQVDFGDQDSLISDIAKVNPRTVAVLETGAPVLTPWRGSLAGLLEAWYPGEDGGTVIAHLLFGDADPSGRLPATFPERAGDIPTAAGGARQYPGVIDPSLGKCEVDTTFVPCPYYQESYSEGVMVGYRSYQYRHITPAYPFGFGLSYTSFRFSALKIKRGSGGTARVSATVANTGRRTGWAVPELYVGLPTRPGVPEPPEQLAGFTKLRLGPGQSGRVSFALNPRSFSYWDTAAAGWRVAKGCDAISVGSSSQNLPLGGLLSQGGADCGRPGCPLATGRLRGRSLGLARLGMTRARVRRLYRFSSNRGRHYQDFFCLTPIGVRVGYASPKELRQITRKRRRQYRGRVVWISTSNRFYAVNRVRPGMRLKQARRRLHLGRAFHVGRNFWYFASAGASRGLLKVRRGTVEEIGIASRPLTDGRDAQRRFLRTFY
jgi:beta-glucosidase